MIAQSPILIEDVDRVIKRIYETIADESTPTVLASMLTMIIMASFPQLEGDDLIKTVENASQLILTLGPTTTETVN